MQHFDAATFDAISFRLDLDWTVQQLVDIAKLLKNKADASRRIAADILDDSIIPGNLSLIRFSQTSFAVATEKSFAVAE